MRQPFKESSISHPIAGSGVEPETYSESGEPWVEEEWQGAWHRTLEVPATEVELQFINNLILELISEIVEALGADYEPILANFIGPQGVGKTTLAKKVKELKNLTVLEYAGSRMHTGNQKWAKFQHIGSNTIVTSGDNPQDKVSLSELQELNVIDPSRSNSDKKAFLGLVIYILQTFRRESQHMQYLNSLGATSVVNPEFSIWQAVPLIYGALGVKEVPSAVVEALRTIAPKHLFYLHADEETLAERRKEHGEAKYPHMIAAEQKSLLCFEDLANKLGATAINAAIPGFEAHVIIKLGLTEEALKGEGKRQLTVNALQKLTDESVSNEVKLSRLNMLDPDLVMEILTDNSLGEQQKEISQVVFRIFWNVVQQVMELSMHHFMQLRMFATLDHGFPMEAMQIRDLAGNMERMVNFIKWADEGGSFYADLRDYQIYLSLDESHRWLGEYGQIREWPGTQEEREHTNFVLDLIDYVNLQRERRPEIFYSGTNFHMLQQALSNGVWFFLKLDKILAHPKHKAQIEDAFKRIPAKIEPGQEAGVHWEDLLESRAWDGYRMPFTELFKMKIFWEFAAFLVEFIPWQLGMIKDQAHRVSSKIAMDYGQQQQTFVGTASTLEKYINHPGFMEFILQSAKGLTVEDLI